MRILVFTCLVVVMSASVSHAHDDLEPNAENFAKFMSIQQASEEEVGSLIQLSIAFSYTNKDSCLLVGERSIEMAEPYPSLYAEALVELGDSYRIFGDIEEGEVLLKKGRAMFVEQGNDHQVAVTDNKLGALKQVDDEFEESLRYYMSALKTWENLNDSNNIVKPLLNMAVVFEKTDRGQLALEYNQRAYEIAEKMGDDRGMGYVANNVSQIYKDFANDYLAKAELEPENAQLFNDSADAVIEIALVYCQIALDITKRTADERGEIRVVGNIANLKMKQGKLEEAAELFISVEQRLENTGALMQNASQKSQMCEIYRKLGQLDKSAKYGEAALALATEIKARGDMAQINRELYRTYKARGEYEKAMTNLELYTSFTEESIKNERDKSIAEIETRYATVKKEKTILEQENDILALEENNIKMKNQRNYLFFGGLSIALLSLFAIRAYSLKRQRNEKMAFAEALIFAQEKERKRIARDLHDGVGQSLLLINKQLDDNKKSTFDNQALITQTLEEVRSISRDLHPFQLDKLGLTAAIEDVVLRVKESSDLFVSSELENIDEVLDKKSELHIFRVIQEAMNNVIKHAEANAVKLTLMKSETDIHIEIMDNGKGFENDFKVTRTNSLGLRTMHERISSIGGDLNMVRVDPKGSNIQIKIPIRTQQNY